MKKFDGGYNGIYRAIVVSNIDPLEMGRVQIRVPFIHGLDSGSGVYDEHLPYAMPCFAFASHDAGTLLVPEENSVVFILFEDGNKDKPVYLGQMYSKARNTVTEVGYAGGDANKKSSGRRIKRAFQDDILKGSYLRGIVQKFTLFKSPKGHTIEMCDGDGEERFSLFDRLGQTITFYSPTSAEYNDGGVNNRGIFSVIKSKFLGNIYKYSLVIIKALSGSKLRFVSHQAYSQTDLQCVYEDVDAGISVKIGRDNRLLLYYGDDTLVELDDSSVNIKSSTLNINVGEMNINADVVKSSSNIKVGDSTPRDIDCYLDEEYEEIVEE